MGSSTPPILIQFETAAGPRGQKLILQNLSSLPSWTMLREDARPEMLINMHDARSSSSHPEEDDSGGWIVAGG